MTEIQRDDCHADIQYSINSQMIIFNIFESIGSGFTCISLHSVYVLTVPCLLQVSLLWTGASAKCLNCKL